MITFLETFHSCQRNISRVKLRRTNIVHNGPEILTLFTNLTSGHVFSISRVKLCRANMKRNMKGETAQSQREPLGEAA
jgi:hypothetical protein